MKKTAVLLPFVLCFFLAGSQNPDWSWLRSLPGAGEEGAESVCFAGAGEICVAGHFSGASLALPGATLSNTGPSASSEAFLVKYDAGGNVVWAKRGQGNGDDEARVVCSDPSGNIYLAGNFESSSLTFGTVTLTNSSTFSDIFLVKYDPAGNVLWARSYGGNLLETLGSLCADNFGNTYLTGTFRSLSVSFGTVGVINSGNSDGFAVKVDVNGNPLWAKQIGGAQDDFGVTLSYDGNGNVYVAGEYNSTTLTSYSLSNAGGMDVFLSKYDAASGSLLAVLNIGGPQNENAAALRADGSGVYFAGTFNSAVLNIGSASISSSSTKDLMLVKLNATFGSQWTFRTNGDASSGPSSLFLSSAGDIFMGGHFAVPSVSFATQVLSNASATGSDGYYVKFNSSGQVQEARSTSSVSDEEIRSVIADNAGNIYVAGVYTPSLALGSLLAGGMGGADGFVARICKVPAAPQVGGGPFVLCTGQSLQLSANAGQGNSVSWYATSQGGNPVSGSSTLNVNVPGTYYAQSTGSLSGCNSAVRTAVTVTSSPAPQVSVSGTVLSTGSGTSYQWIQCQSHSVIPGATSQTFGVNVTGYYAVIVSANGCIDTSACKLYSVSNTGTITVPQDTSQVTVLVRHDTPAEFTVYPNPATNVLRVKATAPMNAKLFNAMGQLVLCMELRNEESLILDLEAGLYYLRPDGCRSVPVLIIDE